jgi:quinol-cytochrome oxidoreductase complex cytochrome b subunit
MRKYKDQRLPLVSDLYNTAFIYPSPSSLNYLYNFGILALMCLIIQIVTGLLLSFHYQRILIYAFASVRKNKSRCELWVAYTLLPF